MENKTVITEIKFERMKDKIKEIPQKVEEKEREK